MSTLDGMASGSGAQSARRADADNLKVWLVVAVIVGHVTLAFAGLGGWVLEEPPVRDPLRSVLQMLAVVGVFVAMATFFMVAGRFTPGSLRRKGLQRFCLDRLVRLGVPMLFFIVVLSPVVEYVDTDNAGWDRGFLAFVPVAWRGVAPGPTWFLGVLLLFSVVYGVVRTRRPLPLAGPSPLRARYLLVAALFVTVASFLVRIAVPFGQEVWHLALGQAPAWMTGFVLGVLGGERGWFEHMHPRLSRGLCWVAWVSAGLVVLLLFAAGALGGEAGLEALSGGGTGASLLLACVEGPLVVAMSPWLVDVFHRRMTTQTPLLAWLSTAAFAAFLVHQVVTVGAVLATRLVAWPPELKYLASTVLAVAASFALGGVLAHVPGIAQIIGPTTSHQPDAAASPRGARRGLPSSRHRPDHVEAATHPRNHRPHVD